METVRAEGLESAQSSTDLGQPSFHTFMSIPSHAQQAQSYVRFLHSSNHFQNAHCTFKDRYRRNTSILQNPLFPFIGH